MLVFSKLHAGGKFGGGSYHVSGGLHGVGISVVNALSERVDLEIWREGKTWQQSYERGVPVAPFEEVGDSDRRGTKITFKPDPQIFEDLVYSYDTLAHRLRELAFLNKGINISSAHWDTDDADRGVNTFTLQGKDLDQLSGLGKSLQQFKGVVGVARMHY